MQWKTTLKSRLRRLETRSEEVQPLMQIGPLRKLPDDYVGERHVVVVKRELTSTPNCEACEFEERPGPEPRGADDQACRVFVSEADMRL
jgi:hypothetical protein